MYDDTFFIITCENHFVVVGESSATGEHSGIVGVERTGIGYDLCRLDGFVEEEIDFILGTSRWELEIGPRFAARPLAVARNKAGSGVIAFPRAFIECYASLQGHRCIVCDSTRFGCILLKHFSGFVEVFEDETGHFVARCANRFLGQHGLIVGHHFLDDGHITEVAQQAEIVPRTEEVALAQIVLHERVAAVECAIGYFRFCFIDEIVDGAQIREVPLRTTDCNGLLVAFVEQVLSTHGTLIVACAVL